MPQKLLQRRQVVNRFLFVKTLIVQQASGLECFYLYIELAATFGFSLNVSMLNPHCGTLRVLINDVASSTFTIKRNFESMFA